MIARSALSSLCALFRSCPVFGVRFLSDFYQQAEALFTHAFAYWDFEKWFLEGFKKLSSWGALASGIWHKRDPLFDHFLSNFFRFFATKVLKWDCYPWNLIFRGSVTPRDVRRCFEIMEIEEDSLKTPVLPWFSYWIDVVVQNFVDLVIKQKSSDQRGLRIMDWLN